MLGGDRIVWCFRVVRHGDVYLGVDFSTWTFCLNTSFSRASKSFINLRHISARYIGAYAVESAELNSVSSW